MHFIIVLRKYHNLMDAFTTYKEVDKKVFFLRFYHFPLIRVVVVVVVVVGVVGIVGIVDIFGNIGVVVIVDVIIIVTNIILVSIIWLRSIQVKSGTYSISKTGDFSLL